MKENQKNCKHDWNPRFDGMGYAVCLNCGVMIHRKDGHLFDPDDLKDTVKFVEKTPPEKLSWWI